MNRRAAPIVPCLAVLLIGACASPAQRKLGDPLEGLTPEEAARFAKGRIEFQRAFEPENGLGPLFNAESCGECHEEPVAGGRGDEIESHVAVFDAATGACDQLVEQGGPVVQQDATPQLKAALGIDKEPTPPAAKAVASRMSPEIFGLGLLDAVPDATILALADPDDRDGDGISGRPNRFVDGRVGRFGRKGFVPTLREFNAGAFPIEMGVTHPEAASEETIGGAPIPAGVDPVPEPEMTQEDFSVTDDYVRFLAPPAQGKLDSSGKQGQRLFSTIGCASCHVPALETGKHPVKALSHRKVYAYSDLLLHDMGEDLADICFGLATPSEFRTQPLRALAEGELFLHDGRAKTVEEAIRLHGGEAAPSRDRFTKLSPKEREALLKFLESL